MTDRISLKGLEVFATHGVLEHEAAHAQPFVVDVVVEVDLESAGRTDRLSETIDYGALAVRVTDLVASETWSLIERVAHRVAEAVLDEPRAAAVEVTVHKPRAPIPVPFADVAVTVRREK